MSTSTVIPSPRHPVTPSPRLYPLVSLYELFERLYRPERLAASPAGTIEQYHVALRHLDRCRDRDRAMPASGGPLTIEDLTRKAILDCRARLIADRRSIATANKVSRHLAALWRFGIEEGLIGEAARPIRRIKEPKRKPKAWKIGEIGKILAALPGLSGEFCGLRASRWWQAFLLVMYDTGLRVSTVMDLRWDHFDARSGELRVPAEIVKDAEDLVHELSVQSLSALSAIRGSGAAEIFPWPWDRDRKWRVLRKHHRRILQAAGLPWQKRTDGGFHKYRRTTASYLKRGGGDPTEHLGHSTQQVTRVYLDRSICRPRRQVDLLPRPKLAEPDPQMRLF